MNAKAQAARERINKTKLLSPEQREELARETLQAIGVSNISEYTESAHKKYYKQLEILGYEPMMMSAATRRVLRS